MSRKGGTSQKATRKPVVVLAGEGDNDRQILGILLQSLNTDLQGRLVQIKDPVRLKTATGRNLEERVRTIVRKARAKAQLNNSQLAGLVVHEDLDAVIGPEYDTVRSRITGELQRQLPDSTCLALAAYEVEAWMLLFPEALEHSRAGWRVPASRRGKNTGSFHDPKRILEEELGRPKYRESDGPDVFRKAVELGLLSRPAGSNRSYQDFLDEVGKLSVR